MCSIQPDCLSLTCRISVVQDLKKGFSRCQNGVNFGAETGRAGVSRHQHSCFLVQNGLPPRLSGFK